MGRIVAMGPSLPVPPLRFPSSSLGRKAWGYDRDATETLFEQVASSYERLWLAHEQLRQQLTAAETERAGFEEQKRLLAAELAELSRSADALVEEARHDAEEMLRKARERAEEISQHAEREARAHAERMLSETRREQARLEQEVARLRALAADTHDRLSSFLHAALERHSQDGNGGALGDTADEEEAAHQGSGGT
jgi:cell division septum initiation protein DivIVA